jgi:Ca2+-binding EF-hand superfamily protein
MALSEAKKKEAKEVFNLYDDDCEQKIDGADIGSCARALGLKPTNAQVAKAAGAEYKRGDKKITLEEFLPIYEALTKEKEQGTFADFMEGLRVFDKDETGKILAAELRHILLALGERLTKDDVDEIMQGVEDGEGMVNYQAFIKKVLAGPFPEEDK